MEKGCGPSVLSCCHDEHHVHLGGSLGRKGCLAFRLQFFITGCQAGGVLCACWLAQLAFLSTPGTGSGMALPTVGWALLYQSVSNQENAPQTCLLGQSDESNPLAEFLSSQGCLDCVMLTRNNQHIVSHHLGLAVFLIRS